MSAAGLVLSWLLPLLLAAWVAGRGGPRWLLLAPLPALATALTVPVGSTLGLDWVLLGVQLQLDASGRLFMLFGGLVWLVAASHVASGRDPATSGRLFHALFLSAMFGNFLLILAADMVTFYVGFAVMGLSAYGLLLRRSQRARRAARVYLGFTLVGELALFAAMVTLYASTGSLAFADLAGQPLPAIAVVLLLVGFGIKVALPGLHPWLPLAYASGPIAAVAVLSGPMMKAGLLGWMRFLPPGDAGLAPWGDLLVALGTLGLLVGVLFGLAQRTPRAVLAYSSIAKMGTISALFGVALAEPVLAAPLTAALVLFAVHHLLIKSSLFLAVGEWQRVGARPWLIGTVVLLAASLAGLPLTGGAAAKLALGDALQGTFGALLTLSAVGTVLLLLRLLWLLAGKGAKHEDGLPPATLAWLGLVLVALWAPFWPLASGPDVAGLTTLVLGGALALAGRALLQRWPELVVQVPPGDLARLSARLRVRLPALLQRRGATGWRLPQLLAVAPAPRPAASLVVPGLLWFAIVLGLLLALVALG